MKKSYVKLEPKHRWLLIALLDCDRNPQSAQLEIAYRRFFYPQKPMEEEILLLEEGFLQKTLQSEGTVIEWIHPSYRDLVIQELAGDEEMAQQFLDKCSIDGIRLAISVAGGASGQNLFPLMSTKKHWETISKRLVGLIKESGDDLTIWQVLVTLRNATDSANDLPVEHASLTSALNDCCIATKDRLDELGEPVYPFVLKMIYECTMLLTPPPPLPKLYSSWIEVETKFENAFKDAAEGDDFIDEDSLGGWASMLSVVSKCDQRLLIKSGFPEKYAHKLRRLCSLIRSELDEIVTPRDEDGFVTEVTRLSEIRTALLDLVGVIPKLDEKINQTSRSVERKSKHLESKHRELEQDEKAGEFKFPDDRKQQQTIDIERLFADL